MFVHAENRFDLCNILMFHCRCIGVQNSAGHAVCDSLTLLMYLYVFIATSRGDCVLEGLCDQAETFRSNLRLKMKCNVNIGDRKSVV